MSSIKNVKNIILMLIICLLAVTCVMSATAYEAAAASTSKVTTSTSYKSSTHKYKLSKASKVTKVTTTIRTVKKAPKVVKNTETKKITKQVTIKTTEKKYYNKNSRIKKVKKTVKTTTKTTTVTRDKFKVSDVNGNITPSLMKAFNDLKFDVKINSNASYSGVFSVSDRSIEMSEPSKHTFQHEMGHFLSTLKNNADSTSEFKSIYKSEKSKYKGNNKDYVTSTNNEYFAESYSDYLVNRSSLKSNRPKTYEYIKKQINSVSDSDVDRMYDRFGWLWE